MSEFLLIGAGLLVPICIAVFLIISFRRTQRTTSTPKKMKDPTEAALSAIQDALQVRDDDKPAGPDTPPATASPGLDEPVADKPWPGLRSKQQIKAHNPYESNVQRPAASAAPPSSRPNAPPPPSAMVPPPSPVSRRSASPRITELAQELRDLAPAYQRVENPIDSLTAIWAASCPQAELAVGEAACQAQSPEGFDDFVRERFGPVGYDVECSVFAPPRPERNRSILVQALLHRAEQLMEAVAMTQEMDPGANRKGFAKLATKIKHGEMVQFFLEIPLLDIEMPVREARWEGRPLRAAFQAHIPPSARTGPCQGTLHLVVGGIPVGEVLFELNIAESQQENPQDIQKLGALQSIPWFAREREKDKPAPVAVDALRFSKAFISYSRKDVQQVLLYAEALDDCGVRLLTDLTDIEPGAEWRSKLVDLIDKADVFYLMWSPNAAESAWVDEETQVAVTRYDRDAKRVPRIRPVVIEQPAPEPPSHLKRFHFNSKWLALRTAETYGLFSPHSPRG